MRWNRHIFLVGALVWMGAGFLRAQDVAATQPALSREALAALRNLSAEEFSTREHALRDLEVAMGQQIQTLLAPDDPESQARISALLEFNEGLSRWVLNTLALPDAQRRAQLAIGLRADMLPIVAKLAAKSSVTRIEGIHEVAQLHDAVGSDLLAPVLDDSDRAVYIAAMEAAWDMPATEAMVDRLWDRAVTAGFAVYSPSAPAAQEQIKFRGRLLGATYFDNAAFRKMQDSDIACEVLEHLNTPLVVGKLVAFFQSVDQSSNNPNPRENRLWLFGPNSAPMKNTYELLTAYHPKEVVPVLYRLATSPSRQGFQGMANNVRYFSSNRTMPLVMVILLTNQKPEDYKQLSMIQAAGTWAFPTQVAEDGAVEKLKIWWQKNPGLHPAETPSATAPSGAGVR